MLHCCKLLHASMREAPLLGSFLDPWRGLRNDLATSDYAGLQAMLSIALTQEREGLLSDNEDLWDAVVSAHLRTESGQRQNPPKPGSCSQPKKARQKNDPKAET